MSLKLDLTDYLWKDESVHVVKHGVVWCTKHKVCLKQFIKSTKRRGWPAGYGILVENDEELVDFILSHSNSQEIGLSTGSDGIEVLLDACSSLRKQLHMERQLKWHGYNIIKNYFKKLGKKYKPSWRPQDTSLPWDKQFNIITRIFPTLKILTKIPTKNNNR